MTEPRQVAIQKTSAGAQKAASAPSWGNRLRSRLPILFIIFSSIGLAWVRLGPEVMSPTNIGWLRGDTVWHFLVWAFFRVEAWQPLPGRIETFLAPLGTSIGSGDALPLLAFPLKALSSVLPQTFQYFGPYLLGNYLLQGLCGYLLTRVFFSNRWHALLAALFFLLSPIMIFRVEHVALSSHWLLLLGLWHYFASHRSAHFRPWRYALLWALIIGLAGLIHPYLAAMLLPLAALSAFSETVLKRRLKRSILPALLLGYTGLLALEWWLSGLVGAGQNLRSGGFGVFSMNLNALYNPRDQSRFLPALPMGVGQYEGFSYLGLGMIALALPLLLYCVCYPARVQRSVVRVLMNEHYWPLFLAVLAFTLYALGDAAWLGEKPIVKLPFFTYFPDLTSTFRASGRFFWPVYYLIFLLLLVSLKRTFSGRPLTLLLCASVALQVADAKFYRFFDPGSLTFSEHLQSERWSKLIAPFDTVAITPAFDQNLASPNDYQDFSWLAASQGKNLTTGHTARPPAQLETVRDALLVGALRGPRDPKSLYVFSAVSFARSYVHELAPGLRCTALDAYVACASGAKLLTEPTISVKTFVPKGYERVSLLDYLNRYRDQTVALTVHEGPGSYATELEQYLAARGSEVQTLGTQGSYLAVLHRGQLIDEALSRDVELARTWPAGTALGQGAYPSQNAPPLFGRNSVPSGSSGYSRRNALAAWG